jgi:hypothetical protein
VILRQRIDIVAIDMVVDQVTVPPALPSKRRAEVSILASWPIAREQAKPYFSRSGLWRWSAPCGYGS